MATTIAAPIALAPLPRRPAAHLAGPRPAHARLAAGRAHRAQPAPDRRPAADPDPLRAGHRAGAEGGARAACTRTSTTPRSWRSAPSACSSRWPPPSPASASSSTATAARSASCSPRPSRARCSCWATCSSCSACARCRSSSSSRPPRCAAPTSTSAPPASPGSSPPRCCSSCSCTAIAETLAARIHQQEEYIGATPVIAILPWFFAGALFPIGALPGALTAFAKVLPLTHAMALMRYGLRRPARHRAARHLGHEQHHRRGLAQPGRGRALRRGLLTVAIRAFTRSAVS